MKKLLLAVLAFFAALGIAMAAVDVNTATQSELETIKGIGPAISAKIIEERKKGAFKDANDLQERVKGIGETSVKKMVDAGLVVGSSKGAVRETKPAADKAAPKADKPAEKAAKADKPAEKAADKATEKSTDKGAKSDKPADKSGKADKAADKPADKAGDKAVKTDKADKPAKGEKSDKAEKSAKPEKSDKAAPKAEKAEKADDKAAKK